MNLYLLHWQVGSLALSHQGSSGGPHKLLKNSKHLEICCVSQGTQTRALYQPRGVGGGERWEGVSEGRDIYIHQWLIHVDV